MKYTPMRRRIALSAIFLPMLAFGQQQTPAEQAEAVLRARVTEFLQYHVEGNFRKAYDMVAEDTKDDYFNSGKAQLLSFKVDDVKLDGDLTKATVTATMSKMAMLVGELIPMTVHSTTTWKIENGKWVWYTDAKDKLASPGPSLPPGAVPAATPAAGGGIPQNLDEKAIVAAAQSILQEVSVDKKEVTLAADKTSEGKVIFHNGMTGSVQLELSLPEVPGLTVKTTQPIVRAGADMPVLFHYEPVDGSRSTGPVTVRVTVQPLNQVFAIRVKFASAAPLK